MNQKEWKISYGRPELPEELLQAGCTPLLAAVLARQYDLEGELASQAVAQSTLFIVISIPALLTLAGMLFH